MLALSNMERVRGQPIGRPARSLRRTFGGSHGSTEFLHAIRFRSCLSELSFACGGRCVTAASPLEDHVTRWMVRCHQSDYLSIGIISPVSKPHEKPDDSFGNRLSVRLIEALGLPELV